jgi:aminoglycoside phosphotransferase family enzyme
MELMPQLPEMVQALLNPKAYPETYQQVELAQTQMSFVFLTDDYVYKVKKPVNLGYLDYTTLDKRRFFCQREVELNRRLCPDVYLGVVTITRDKSDIVVNGQGEVIDCAVKMRRLPQAAMMDRLLPGNQVSPQMITSVAQKLAEFHRAAETNATINTFGQLETIIQNTEENFTQTKKYIGSTISQETYQRIKKYTDNFIAEKAPMFHKRIEDNRIRDCHGDLHAAHICFTNGICIYDCIEFNDRFRYCDTASEVAFLAMDLDLLRFYKCYRAYVRGKVESFKLDDPHISGEEKTRVLDVARSYFELAESYV